jgi:chaperonin GroEL
MKCEYTKPLICIVEKKITSINEILPILKEALEVQKRPLFIITEDIEGEALQLLVYNRIKANAKVCAIKSPG